MTLFFQNSKIQLIVLMCFTSIAFNAQGANPAIGIQCPCEIERVNETKAVASFSIVFQQEMIESGDLILDMLGGSTIDLFIGGSASRLGEADIGTIAYSLEPVDMTVNIPLNYIPEDKMYLAFWTWYDGVNEEDEVAKI